jgi:hypothetical protein
MDLENMPTVISKLKTRNQVLKTLARFDYGIISVEYYELLRKYTLDKGGQLYFIKQVNKKIKKLKLKNN